MAHQLVITLTDEEYEQILKKVEEVCTKYDDKLIPDWKEKIDDLVAEETKEQLLKADDIFDMWDYGGLDSILLREDADS